jgi:toxin ParE1/3/4
MFPCFVPDLMRWWFPQIGRAGRAPGARELVIAGTAYIIPYRVSAETLQILRVYHTARIWPESFE